MRSRAIASERKSKVLIWPSKRSAAPETSGTPCAKQAALIAWRVAKLSVQSSTTVAFGTWASSHAASARTATVVTFTPGFSAASVCAGRIHLRFTNRCPGVQDLALEIGEIDGIGIDQRDLADTRRRQIHRGRRPEPARTDDDRVRIEKALLRFDADFIDEDMAGIAEKLIVVHRALK